MSFTSDEKVHSVNILHDTYRFTRKLGGGGFSDVFLAEKRDTGEFVAIKMMKTGSSEDGNERKTDRFRREMMLYSQLDHPNIVKVYDSGETDNGILFIVFEFIKGQNLADLLKTEGALSVSRSIDLMKQVLCGLGEAHAKGIIHRDLKPENIMIIAEGISEKIKILDFGISTFVQGLSNDTRRLTMTREFLGTPVYSAPEQLRGDSVSVKIDIYAWGLIFLECLTGRSPFSGQTIPAVVQQQLASSPIPLPSAIINHQLGTLLRWTLEKNAERRAGIVPVIFSHLETVSIESIPQQNGFLTGDLPGVESESSPQIVIYDTGSTHQERRQVTALCCTVDIWSHQSVIENELLDEIYQDLMETGKNLFRRFGAYVAKDSGDRIFAYFGFPDAGDTDAHRAARSALELANILTKRNAVFINQYGIGVTFRIGINTGAITVRRNSQNITVLSGIVLYEAGKLCRVAEQDSIRVGKSCFSLLEDSMELVKIFQDDSPGLHSKEQAYKIIGEKRYDSLIDIFTDNVSPMIGRDGELARLYDTWKVIQDDGIGNVILLQGDAGIGKSRLAAEFARKIAKENGKWLECRCLPEGKNSALHPVLGFLRNLLRIIESSNPKDASLSLEHHLKSFGMDCSIAMPLFGSWLGVPADGYTMPQFSPQKQKEIIMQLSSEILARTAQDSGSVIMIEDIHWADPTTIEFLPKLFEQVKIRGIMLCMSARPAFVPPWDNHNADVISLSGLNDEHVEEVVRSIFGSEEIGRDTLSNIINRVDGVPLFIEEIAKLIREKKINKDEIPSTLIDLLTSKMDLLGPARETAELASVIGREFDYNLIAKISYKEAASLLADLDHLISAGIIHNQLVVGNPHYVFHHSLVRDAAYEKVDKKLRREIHYRIAEILEREYEKTIIPPELIAHHWAGAEKYQKAIHFGSIAANSMLGKSLYYETITLCYRMIEWTGKESYSLNKVKCELEIRQKLHLALSAVYGYATDEVVHDIERSEILIKEVDEVSELKVQVLWKLLLYHHVTADYKKFNDIVKDTYSYLLLTKDDSAYAAVLALHGQDLWAQGFFDEAIRKLNESSELYSSQPKSNHVLRFGHDTKLFALATLGMIYCMRGETNKSDDIFNSAMEWAHELRNTHCTALVMSYRLGTFHYMDELDMAKKYAEELMQYLNIHDLPNWKLPAIVIGAWANKRKDDCIAGLKIMEVIGIKQLQSYWNVFTSQIDIESGNFQEANDRLEKYIKQAEDVGELFYVPELLRLKALCLLNLNYEISKVVELIERSLCLSRTMGTGLFETKILKLKGTLHY